MRFALDASTLMLLSAMLITLITAMVNMVILMMPGGRRSRLLACGGLASAAGVTVSMAMVGTPAGTVLGTLIYGAMLAGQFLAVRAFFPAGRASDLTGLALYAVAVSQVVVVLLHTDALPLRSLLPTALICLSALLVTIQAARVRERLIAALFLTQTLVAGVRVATLIGLDPDVRLVDYPLMQAVSVLLLVGAPTLAAVRLRLRSTLASARTGVS